MATLDPVRVPYGPHPDQWADLYLPAPGPRPGPGGRRDDGGWRGVAVVIHGGYWREKYTAELGVPVARDLVAHGIAAWNLEYRRAAADGPGGTPTAGDGGWPATFLDVAAGIDRLADVAGLGVLADDDAARLAGVLSAGRVVGLGHSAGGHLAVWAAGRHRLPAGAPGAAPDGATPDGAAGAGPRVALRGVVSQAGVLSLAEAEARGLSNHAARNLMGGASADSAELARAFALADPMCALPIGVPVHAVHSRDDEAVPFALSEDYVAAARAAGDPAVLHVTTGDHRAVIDPGHEAYRLCRSLVEELLG
ncbi:acetyl esterase/lipase [Sinomonas atrocyanea]|uniref:alpha/beta hydrolase family protein n=1 Tax=Sinomonas atrocyanea TaxID=37927 RepID=UPI0027899748|nr:alpha/beta hydrolase [Sinomonas atrocyanea]MDQ0261073.1 acetyl esterase/lipase [Sinomonas atrocyanea]